MAFLSLSDVSLYYEDRGEGPAVLLIHGAGGYADLYGTVIDELSETHRVVAYDRRSFARSEHPPARDIRIHTDDVAKLIDQLFEPPVVVVGWSAGGAIALDLAIKHPQLVRSLVLAEPGLLLKAPRLALFVGAAQWEAVRLFRGAQAAAPVFYRWVSQYRNGGNAFDKYPEAWRSQMICHADSLFAEARVGSGTGGEFLSRKDLAGIHCPMTLLVGERSAFVFMAAARYLQRLQPKCEFMVVPGASHMIPTDAPHAVVEAVRAACS